MVVLRIEEYGNVLKVILKPTKKFPVGYFYTDNNQVARELVESYNWYLSKQGKSTCVIANTSTPCTGRKILYYHQEYAKRVLGYYPTYLDHVNGLEFDNRDTNLNVVTSQQNNRNKPTIGYNFVKSHVFQPNYTLDRKIYYKGSLRSEPEALIATYFLRKEVFQDYDYNFYLDRRDDSDILDLEITRKITSQEAIYFHVKRYAGTNPWYAYRYNLFDYCRQYNIQIPSFSLDSEGFMIDSIGKRLCPYK